MRTMLKLKHYLFVLPFRSLNRIKYFYNGLKPPWKISARFLCQLPENVQKWESVVGLEVHAQINSASKMFSASATDYMTPTNMQVSFFDAALPGTLPVLNRRCVEVGVLTALALNCTIHKESSFDRKHYFYADMPAGYQITQQRNPLATDGYLDFVVFQPSIKLGPYSKRSHLIQLQLEQDSGKSFHDEKHNRSLIDLNRAGIGLIELVFDADLRNGEECAALVKELQLILKRLDSCTAKMEEGQLRVDANISVNRPGDPRGVRTEVKNLNSIRFLAKAVDFEIQRQIRELENGGTIVNETRTYDMKTKLTLPMRDKEEVQDYRYMPEPNLPPLRLSDDPMTQDKTAISISEMRKRIPVLPADERKRLASYGLQERHAIVLVNQEMTDMYCALMKKEARDPNMLAYWMLQILLKQLNDRNLHISQCCVPASRISDVLDLVETSAVTFYTSSDVLSLLFDGDKRHPLEIAQQNNWKRISDIEEVENICQVVIGKHALEVKRYKRGNPKYLKSLIMHVQVEANGRVDAATVKDTLTRLLRS